MSGRGVEQARAGQVAEQLMPRALWRCHARDDRDFLRHHRPPPAGSPHVGRDLLGRPRPGRCLIVVAPASWLVATVSAASLVFLALLGTIGARAGGANVWRATIRVTF